MSYYHDLTFKLIAGNPFWTRNGLDICNQQLHMEAHTTPESRGVLGKIDTHAEAKILFGSDLEMYHVYVPCI